MLICPFLVAWLLSKCLPKVHQKLLGYHELAFYLWAVSLAIVTAQTLYSLLNDPADGFTEIMIAIGALVACCLQFFLGKTIGSIYNDRISGGQALGQKNTILAIWMAHTYLNPLSAVAPGSYVLWQNIINSWQLWKKRKICGLNINIWYTVIFFVCLKQCFLLRILIQVTSFFAASPPP